MNMLRVGSHWAKEGGALAVKYSMSIVSLYMTLSDYSLIPFLVAWFQNVLGC